jgi:hypothetical protein
MPVAQTIYHGQEYSAAEGLHYTAVPRFGLACLGFSRYPYFHDRHF